jgi:hypothetical protein
VTVRPDLLRLAAALDALDPRACDPAHAAALRARLVDGAVVGNDDGGRIVRADETLGAVGRYGTVTLYLPGATGRRPVLVLDRQGHPTVGIRRGPDGGFLGAWLRNVDGGLLGVAARAAEHPLWGASDRILRLPLDRDGVADLLTVSAATDWDRPAEIPALAEPARLPPGAGTTILNLLAALAVEHGPAPLRYHGPYPTEQLFWALVESFRFAPAGEEPVAGFTRDAETLALSGERRQAPLDWTPAPAERLFHDEGIYVQLRDGIEKVWWEGRAYYRTEWQGLVRRDHRVVRRVAAPDARPVHVARLEALGEALEDHLVLDADGDLIACPAREHESPAGTRDVPAGPLWRDALRALLPLDATPLLAPSLAAVSTDVTIAWGPVTRDLVEVRGTTIRLALSLARAHRTAAAPRGPGARRALAQQLVRTVLDLVGGPARALAAAWLAAEPPARQEAWLAAAAAIDRRQLAAQAAPALGRLLDALEVGAALPDG